mgnify:CR=1 FL=1
MNFEIQKLSLARAIQGQLDAMIVLWPSETVPDALGHDPVTRWVATAIEQGDFELKAGTVLTLYCQPGISPRHLVVVCTAHNQAGQIRSAVQTAWSALKSAKVKQLGLHVVGDVTSQGLQLALSCLADASYSYTTTLSKPKTRLLKQVTVSTEKTTLALENAVRHAQALVSGVELAKEWADSAATKRSTKIVAILLVTILVSLATFGYLYQDMIREEADALQDYLGGKKPAAQDKSDPAPAPAATVSMSSSNSPAPKSPDIVLSEKEELVSPSTPAIPSPPVAAAPSSPSPAPTPAVPEPAAAPAPSVVEAKKKPEIAAEKSAGADDPVWVSKLDGDTWVLQHGAFDSLAEAKAFQANSSLFKSAQVLFSQRKGGKSFYIVLTGPYEDKAMAETQMRQNPAMAKAWLRTSKSLKAQFQD